MHSSVVIGTAIGYTRPQLEPFVLSLKETGYAGETVLFVDEIDEQAIEFLQLSNVRTQRAHKHRDLSGQITVTGGRFFLYRDFLDGPGAAFENVLLTDVRDVIFQRDPFLGYQGPISFFLESSVQTYRENACNSEWLRIAYGDEMLASLADKPVSCVGTILGVRKAMLKYVHIMCNELSRFESVFWGCDQAAHNYVVYNKSTFRSCIVPCNGDVVFDVGLSPASDIAVDADQCIRPIGAEVPPIIHKYDRHPHLQALVGAKYTLG